MSYVYERVEGDKNAEVTIASHRTPGTGKKVGWLGIEVRHGWTQVELTRKQFRQVRDAIDKILNDKEGE